MLGNVYIFLSQFSTFQVLKSPTLTIYEKSAFHMLKWTDWFLEVTEMCKYPQSIYITLRDI